MTNQPASAVHDCCYPTDVHTSCNHAIERVLRVEMLNLTLSFVPKEGKNYHCSSHCQAEYMSHPTNKDIQL